MMLHEGSSYSKMKASSDSRIAEENRNEQRKKNILALIVNHLQSEGYNSAAERLQTESGMSNAPITVADNMDLTHVLQEFETFYHMKFGKAPKIIRKTDNNTKSNVPSTNQRRKPQIISTKHDIHGAAPTQQQDYGAGFHSPEISAVLSKTQSRAYGRLPKIDKKPPSPKAPSSNAITSTNGNGNTFNPTYQELYNANLPVKPTAESTKAIPSLDGLLAVKPTGINKESSTATLTNGNNNNANNNLSAKDLFHQHPHNDTEWTPKLLRPLPDLLNGNNEYRDLAMIIQRDIFVENPDVRFKDIKGLDVAKRLVKEAVVYPMKYPELFQGLLSSWRGILLFGPPGTGKTMLAKAVATECKTTFFNISASSIVSKWRGDSEKLVRVLFELARYHAPSVIFLDELESIMSQRSSDGSEHEGSRRMKTELLIQMDGLSKSDAHVVVLAASNLPWDLDTAMLRRLEKRIMVGLPDVEARKAMMEYYLPTEPVSSESASPLKVGKLDYENLSKLTEGYSGSDIKLVCKEAAMRPLRKVFDRLELMEQEREQQDLEANEPTHHEPIVCDPVKMNDVLEAIECTKPACDTGLEGKYVEWRKNHASN